MRIAAQEALTLWILLCSLTTTTSLPSRDSMATGLPSLPDTVEVGVSVRVASLLPSFTTMVLAAASYLLRLPLFSTVLPQPA